MPAIAAIDGLLEAARARLDRVEPADLLAEIEAGALVVDTRTVEQRQRDGELPGAVVVDRTVLEWRLDPTCPHHIPEVTNADRRIIVVCDEGYSSSLAAATLRDLGLGRATDLIGGFQAWRQRMTDDRQPSGHEGGAAHEPDVPRIRRWLASTYPFIREHLPTAPARIIELGCGPLGGFVPMLRADGYDALGVDPEAPEGPHFQRTSFERADVGHPADALVACTSLHHVADLAEVVERIASGLVADGVLVVVEWAWERFDEATARWCFARLGTDEGTEAPDWLRRHRDAWAASDQPWDSYLTGWARTERLHRGDDILLALRARFDVEVLANGPYFFADLDGTTTEDELAAIDAELIRPTCLRWVGRPRTSNSQ